MSRAQAVDVAYRDSLNTLVRKVLVISLALGCPSIIAMIFVLGPSDPVVRWSYPPLLVHLLVYAWVLVRASSNKPELVVVVESMTSDDDMKALFREEVKPRLGKFAEVGKYNQEI